LQNSGLDFQPGMLFIARRNAVGEGCLPEKGGRPRAPGNKIAQKK